MLGGGEDGSYNDNGSRWGIKGSTELSEGLSAVYNFEAKIDSSHAGQPDTGRLSYLGLSGGFGSVTMGQIWSAAYNHAGGWRYLGPWFGSGDTDSRIGSAVSYAYSSEMASFQVDAYMDGDRDTGNTVDEFQFGATINLGDIGKLGIGYRDVEDTFAVSMATPSDMGGSTGGSTGGATGGSTGGATGGSTGGAMKIQETNSDEIIIGRMIHKPGTLNVWTLTEIPSDEDADPIVTVVYEVPGEPGPSVYYLKSQADDPEEATLDKVEVDTTAASFMKTSRTNAADLIIDGKRHPAETLKVVTVTTGEGAQTITKSYYEVPGPVTGTMYYTKESLDDETKTDVLVPEARVTNAQASDEEGSGLVKVYATAMTEPEPEEPMTEPEPEEPMMSKRTVKDYGHTEAHVTLQLDLGAMTGTLGYSEIDNNDPDKKMDKKITFLGLNGAIGDTGMSWTAYSRKIDDHDGSDSNPWGLSLTKSLGGGASVYIDHGDNDGGKGGETFVGMNVNF